MIRSTLFSANLAIGPAITIAALFLGTPCWSGTPEKKVCAELLQANLVDRWSDDKLFYRGPDRKLKAVLTNDALPRYIDQLFYFTRTSTSQESAKSVLNWKFVYTTTSRPNRQTLVGLYNDRWTASQLARSSAACSNVSVEGYDNFHFYGTSNICLRFHFHQQDPDTLATAGLRRSFAFGDMIPRTDSDFLSTIGSFFSSPAKASDATDSSTIRGTLAKSWIRNFTYEPDVTCVTVTPSFPDNAKTLHLQIINHGTQFVPETHDWFIKFSD
ncbi:hypothetical protein [Bradyrhizobium sp. dw_78]|uniref:hypothetical protein n=1 Tax=Bradyrhizobium sp. dw_78 TaxID=2719793 RepID=UPI001BD558EE|nr:hypothetical protein [Bradyrhizobium sp. dw_78]